MGTLISAFPGLETRTVNRNVADREARRWLSSKANLLKSAWDALQIDSNLPEWSHSHRKMIWPEHVQMFKALFMSEHIPYISSVLNCSTHDLEKIYLISCNVETVKAWAKQKRQSEDLQLALDCWLMSGLIRGKYHECLAQHEQLQLIAHPYRAGIGKMLRPAFSENVYYSEEYFSKIVIGGALLETTAKRRVVAWVKNVQRARVAIEGRSLELPNAVALRDAEQLAIAAAKRIGIATRSEIVHRALDVGTAIGLGALVSLTLYPWFGPVGPIIIQAYRYFRGGGSVGDDIGRYALSTSRRFRTLARSVPGRIEREIRFPR